MKPKSIDRYDLVNRHNITICRPDPLSSLSVGNGEFAFTADITGLQTFPEFYEHGISLGTLSQWGWHSLPNVCQYTLEEVEKWMQVGGRSVPYVYRYSGTGTRKDYASEWLRENPHRLHLGLIGLELLKEDSTSISIEDIQNAFQQLNLWTGELTSHFHFEGLPVNIRVICHPDLDMLAISIRSPLIRYEKLRLKFNFPYGDIRQTSSGINFDQPQKHSTLFTRQNDHRVTLERRLDSTQYFVEIFWQQSAEMENPNPHQYRLVPCKEHDALVLCCLFSQKPYPNSLPDFNETEKMSRSAWEAFWMSGGAVDFSACKDSGAHELERRVVLSQYLTKIQCSGSLPPQETGLTFNSWYGKFHLEMHWWHAAHFIAWNRPELMKHQLDYYKRIMEKARETARHQKYEGIRWPKMTDPSGTESPSSVGPFLIWQQPHMIYFAELLYQQLHDRSVLEQYRQLVFETADFMASYARWDSLTQRFVLGPGLMSAQEVFRPETTMNPAFELAYWYWGLETAQTWKKRLGLKENPFYQKVLDNLSALSVQDSLYLFTEDRRDSYINPDCQRDHPIVLGVYGFIPETPLINRQVFAETVNAVLLNWNWDKTWGWDYPLAAIAAAKLNRPEQALELLLKDVGKNTYLMNGHNYQDPRLRIYLPGNGGLLYAIAFMCSHSKFPKNGLWDVRWENMGNVL
ncbi:hypothetical protein JW835_16355 [bacterium]|nr:hypothetical protein [bacterium]